MADIMHSTCKGRLQALVPRQPPANPLTSSTSAQSWKADVAQYGDLLGSWLSKHADVLYELELDLWAGQEEAVAAGLRSAVERYRASMPAAMRSEAPAAACGSGAAPGQSAPTAAADGSLTTPVFPLERFKCTSASNGLLLCALAGTHLTELELHLQLQDGVAAAQEQRAALASLRDLRSINLTGAWCGTGFLPMLGPALAQLTHLTQLQLQRVMLDASSAQLLPLSLQELTVCCNTKPLHLQHLTNLRSLHLKQQLLEGETLPPSLTAVQLGRCESVQPLLQLPQLHSLKVTHDLTAEQLQQLAGVSSLQDLDLSYAGCQQGHCCETGTLATAAAHLSSVPVKQLKVVGQWGCGHMPAAVVRQLAGLTQLTSLSLQDLFVDAAPGELLGPLQDLSALQHLELRCLRWPGSGEGEDALADMLVGMSRLRDLSWVGARGTSGVCLQSQQSTQSSGQAWCEQVMGGVTAHMSKCTL